jgi:hypothetical protein
MRLILSICFLIGSFVVDPKPTVKILAETSLDDRLLASLQKNFLENFKVNYELIKIDSVGDQKHVLRNINDGSLLSNHKIVREKGVYYIFLTCKPISFEDLPSNDSSGIRGYSAIKQGISIVSTSKIKYESSKLGLPFEFQFIKAVKHEFIHLLGLGHCETTKRCMMVSSFPESNFHNSVDCVCTFCLEKIDSTIVKPRFRKCARISFE